MSGNTAFIDGQNLFLGTRMMGWLIDYKKFRQYLSDVYNVETAYYFVGREMKGYQWLYTKLEEAGFIVVFREHTEEMLSEKKGNVDADIIFEMLTFCFKNQDNDRKVVLVSGDGDFFRSACYLIENRKLLKVLFPSGRRTSSLYKRIESKYKVFLFPNLKNKLGRTSVETNKKKKTP